MYWTESQLHRLSHRNRDLFFDRWQHCLAARAEGIAPPQREFDVHSWSAMIGKAGVAETALESGSLKAARNVAQLDRHVGYLSAVISSCAGELGGLRVGRDQHLSELNAVRALLKQPLNVDRIDLKERESELDAAGAVLNERIADIENLMQRELAALSAAREELALINPVLA
jgi:hypothetical protein